MQKHANVTSARSHTEADEFNPLALIQMAGNNPSFSFIWGDPNEKAGKKIPAGQKKKRRLICRPNDSMERLHGLYEKHLAEKIQAMGKKETYGIRMFPSATGCVKESNPRINAKKHECGEHFYITDFAHAYPSVDMRRLALLLVYIEKYEHYRVDYPIEWFARNELVHFALSCDPLFPNMESFVKFAFGGLHGVGLAVGGPLSPYLLNLYCEIFLDSRLRYYFFQRRNIKEPAKNVTYTRYVDDLVFSSGERITTKTRQDIRMMIMEALFEVKHRKSFVQRRQKGTVFVTKVGLRIEHVEQSTDPDEVVSLQKSILVFPQKKRRRLHGIIQSYLRPIPQSETARTKLPGYWNDSPEVISGIIAEFLHHYKNVEKPTATDEKTMALCREFERVAWPHLQKLRWARERNIRKRKR